MTSDMQWRTQVLKEIPSVENKLVNKRGSGLEMSFEFLPGMQWGDGVPLTCKDVGFAIKVGKANTVSTPDRSKYDNITDFKIDSGNTKKCTVTFKQAKYDFLPNMPDILPEHLESSIFEKFGSQPQGYDRNSLYTTQPTNPGLYFGPYVVSEVKLGDFVSFVVNPKFTGEPAKIKRVMIKLVPNSSVLEANLSSDNINMIASWGGFTTDQAVSFQKKVESEKLPYKVSFENASVYSHMDFNLASPILSDVKVRKALTYGLNRQMLVDILVAGKAVVASQFVSEKDPWFSKQVTKYNDDTKKAGQLLDEAGWKMGQDGYRSKDGKMLNLTLMSNGGNKSTEIFMALIQKQWKKIGVQIKIKTEIARIYYAETLPNRNFDIALYTWVSLPESSPRAQLTTASIPNAANGRSGQNYMGYSNPKVDSLIDKLEVEFNATKRAAIAREIIKYYVDELPVLPLYFKPVAAVIPSGLKKLRLSGNMYPETLEAEQWTF